MTVVLTAMNRFINEADGSQTAFLDGNQPDRLCAPMKSHIEARGGEVRTGTAVEEILTNHDGSIAGLKMRDGSIIEVRATFVCGAIASAALLHQPCS